VQATHLAGVPLLQASGPAACLFATELLGFRRIVTTLRAIAHSSGLNGREK
jgi:hypothetical protein